MALSMKIVMRVFPFSKTTAPRLPFEKSYSALIGFAFLASWPPGRDQVDVRAFERMYALYAYKTGLRGDWLTTPCSVKAYGRNLRCPPPPWLRGAICDLKASYSPLEGRNAAISLARPRFIVSVVPSAA